MYDHGPWRKRTSKLTDNNQQASGRVLAGPTMGRLNIHHASPKHGPLPHHAQHLDKLIMKDELNSEIDLQAGGKQT